MDPRSLLDGLARPALPRAWRVDASQPVRQHMQRGLHYVGLQMLVDELALFMTEAKIATIPVLDHAQRPLGMVSWSDLQGPRAQPSARVRDIMTFGIATVHQGVSLESAAARLIDQGRDRLIVVDDDGAAVGSLSLDDLRGRLLEPLPGEERSSSRGTVVEMDAARRTRQGRLEPSRKD